ncbi:receptor-type tyrosine-protein phosphatase eta-like [Misgurnus anguillicaudatus]|uniref:receptor-type tyrosine-protein phosphatase eta-like n=1 Tax=Misgurnus anguillicaudatus TaxID=75329 RepID=UPI003CCF8CF3
MARVLLMLCLFVVSTWIKPIVSVPNVQNVSVAARSETELTLKWFKDNRNYSYILCGKDESIQFSYQIDSDEGDVVTHTVSFLSPGTEYTFTIYTVLEDKQSSGYNYTTVTSPPDIDHIHTWQNDKYIDLYWHNYDSKYDYVLKFENSEIFIFGYLGIMRHSISSLSPLTRYNFTLFTVFKNVKSRGYNFSLVTDPANVYNVSVSDRTENEVTLEWSKVHNISSYFLWFNRMEMFINGSDDVSVVRHTVSSLSPGRIYFYSLRTVFDTRESSGYQSYAVTGEVYITLDPVKIVNQSDYLYFSCLNLSSSSSKC